jgi:hypothetical protein
MTTFHCNNVTFELYLSDEEDEPRVSVRKKYPVILRITDFNIRDYKFQLTARTAKSIAVKLKELSNLSVVKDVMET